MFDTQKTLSNLLIQCRAKAWKDYGLNILTVRDLHTGAPIGFIAESVFHTALIDEGVLDDSDDGTILSIEDLADALLVRSLASARPSPALNRPTTQSLKRLLESQPAVVCAYLLNRYKLANWRKLNHRDDSWFDDMLHRVKVWEKLSWFNSFGDPGEAAIRALSHWLLELDSKCNLHDLTPPAGWFEAFHGIESIEQFGTFAKEFALIATPLLVEADKHMTIGNRMTSSAYVKSWFDNPALAQRKVEIANNKRQRVYDRYGLPTEIGLLLEAERLEAKAASREKKAKLDARIIKGRSARGKSAKLVNKHAGVLEKLFRQLGAAIEEGAPERPEPTPTPKPTRVMGLPTAVKKG